MNKKFRTKFNFYGPFLLGILLISLLGLSASYVVREWKMSVTNWSEEGLLKIYGSGTELIDIAKSPEGKDFLLVSQFDFTNDEFHCTLLPNEYAFEVATYSLGHIPLPADSFAMQMDSVEIESIRRMSNGSVEMMGKLNSMTRAGDFEESAVVSFRAVMADGGAGYKRDSLIVTVFYNESDSPLQFGIFGPAPRFGWGRKILSGDIKVWYEAAYD